MAVEFKERWFAKELILQCIHEYLAYALSYRDLEEMMAERGVVVYYSTIHSWVVRNSPELDAEFRRGKRPVGSRWRVDETTIKVEGAWECLYRAVDKNAKTVDFLLSARRNAIAAYRLFLEVLGSSRVPKKLATDRSGSNEAAADLFVDDLSPTDKPVEIRQVKYLNDLVEQGHRGVKRRDRLMLGFKLFLCAQRVIAGIELFHRLRKGQHEDSQRMSPADLFYRLAG